MGLLLKLSIALMMLLMLVECKMCPDHSECQSQSTCCKMISGEYGCCPFQNAVCCSDKMHCCPSGLTCDLPHERCNAVSPIATMLHLAKWDRNEQFQQFSSFISTKSKLQKLRPKKVLPDPNYICPDHHTQCNGTCCRISQSEYGCCPMQHAVCCSDRQHCCPQGTVCDVQTASCKHREENSDGLLVITEEGFQEIEVRKPEPNYICPDHRTQCNGTCCRISQSEYGCCPMQHAVCCSDRQHCCPQGTVCDVQTASCKHREENSEGLLVVTEEGFQEIEVKKPDVNYVCPDHHTQCNNGTCCRISDTGYGCCPMPHAVCCSDRQHCCPQGTVCDVQTASCKRREDGSNGMLVITEEGYREIEIRKTGPNYVCPDHHTQCNGTCCRVGQSEYGCCPLSHAVCCSDQKHCCPQDTVCDVRTASCRRREESPEGFVVYSEEGLQEIEIRKADLKNVCPGSTYECPDDQTCCMSSAGEWLCCPYPNAVCCSDGEHCCPQGDVCDLQHKRCIQQNSINRLGDAHSILSLYNKTLHGVVCPDGVTCPDQSSCCLLADEAYGCCPYTYGVCCADRMHCCPPRHNCDLQKGGCVHQENGNVMIMHNIYELDEDDEYADYYGEKQTNSRITYTPCPGFKESCPDGNTCCQTAPDSYGCCPISHAVCCPDNLHCCPEGTKCNSTTGSCIGETSKVMPWVAKTPSQPFGMVDTNSVCPDNTTQCTESETCCENPGSGGYWCCPQVEGVCCKTKAKCCGKDHRCTQKGKCKHKKH